MHASTAGRGIGGEIKKIWFVHEQRKAWAWGRKKEGRAERPRG